MIEIELHADDARKQTDLGDLVAAGHAETQWSQLLASLRKELTQWRKAYGLCGL